MSTAFQYDASGYFIGEVEDGGLLPNNATYTQPEVKEGSIPHWTGEAWEQVENHIGEEGYVSGEPFTVTEYGALPEGWSNTAPEPTDEEKYSQEEEEIKSKYTDATNGILAKLKDTITMSFCEETPDEELLKTLRNKYQTALSNMKQEIADAKKKYNINEESL